MNGERRRQARPYWHVDLKWLCGLLLVPLVGSALLVYTLVQLTEERPATEIMALAAALMLSRNGLDDGTEIAEMRRALAASPTGVVRPIPGLRFEVRSSDLEGASAREIRLSFFRRFVGPLYKDGAAGLAALADEPEMKQRILEGGGMLGLLGLETHRRLESILRGLAAACAALLAAMIFFSHRFGRVVSPGVVLLAASLPGASIAFALARAPEQSAPMPQAELPAMAGYLLGQLAPKWARLSEPVYLLALAAGAALILLALSGGLIWRFVGRPSATPELAE